MGWFVLFGTISLVVILILFCYPYLLYPGLLAVLAAVKPAPVGNPEWTEPPSVTLIIAAYNEADVIGEKVENALELAYPDEQLEIIVFSDGSTDGTDDIVREYESERVTLIRVEGRVGKTACQNRVIKAASGDILVFSDADSMYNCDAIQALVRAFDRETGCVVGELQYADTDGESAYWRYERLIKRLESKTGSTVAGNGAIYAVRANAYEPLPPDAISDFEEGLALLEQGWRVTYQPDAVARERTEDTSGEFDRRIRIVTRSLHGIGRFRTLLNPLRSPEISFKLHSHKLLRWATPFWLVVILLVSVVLALAGSTFALALLGVQAICYVAAAIGFVLDRQGRQPRSVYLPYYFLVANYGIAQGLLKYLTSENVVVWETSAREGEE
jgi:cellulose synthase/poly-beta-1,6-N-acetylglucosamine synthase-like glycosyltransferase